MSPVVFAVEVRTYSVKEWYFTCGSMYPERYTSNPPIYATHQNRMINIKL